MTGLRTASLIAALITTGISAGLFFIFTNTIMPSLKKSSDRSFVEVMWHINRVILNGWFMLAFMGALLFIALAGGLLLGAESELRSAVLPWVVAALVLYLGTVGITFAMNMPLNNDLDAAGPVEKVKDLAALREHFEAKWVRWNAIRTYTNVAAFGALSAALLQYGRHTGS
ncbi:DUF1772 domain-containing protein [Streptomyces sp. A7024]|uniref:DUF1772 domain-containing protein n=1 Tax=Streptomyces coryli TaxID=1128680 RepID=A0A6G4U754_9ACTN|nr:anthrone oxygenase family protein [Streptomyces coryli]NGN68069.1 DUF1772 domain-containing protein [Streptomyces coryli]